MQVTHTQDHITHAVISSNKAIDFGMSDSAEFFHILSSTLYSDQVLAVVRETICNAWDAHIEAGKTDTPIQITLTQEYLTIRDFGSGIHPDMIGPIYGVYGGSTKKNNDGVTGGFGLGCKAPFAKTDNFEVTSYHDGQMTVYALSKSNAEVGGKPSIMPIVTVPTQETGLQVKIPISAADFHDYHAKIHRIIYNGDINAEYNGDLIADTIRLDKAEFNWMLTRNSVYPTSNNRILIRYGNVIYPLDQHEDFSTIYEQLMNKIRKINSNRDHYRLVIQAEPNSISITPSRESLSLQKKSIDSIKILLDGVNSNLDKDLRNFAADYVNKSFAKIIEDKETARFYSSNSHHNDIHYGRTAREIKSDMYTVKEYQTSLIYSSDFINSSIINQYKKKMYKHIRDETKINHKAIKDLQKKPVNTKANTDSRSRYYLTSDYYRQHTYRYIIYPLMKRMEEDGSVDVSKLLICHSSCGYLSKQNIYALSDYKKISEFNEGKARQYLRKIVVISHNQIDITNGSHHTHMFKDSAMVWDNFFVYLAPRVEAKLLAVREFFDKSEYTVIDLTEGQKGLTKPRKVPTVKEGLFPLSCLIVDNVIKSNRQYKYGNGEMVMPAEHTRLKDPKYVIVHGHKEVKDHFGNFEKAGQSLFIAKMFGKETGIVSNKNQLNSYLNRGAKALNDHILDTAFEFYNTDEFKQFKKNDFYNDTHLRGYYGDHKSGYYGLKLIMEDEILREYFDFYYPFTADQIQIMKLGRIAASAILYHSTDTTKDYYNLSEHWGNNTKSNHSQKYSDIRYKIVTNTIFNWQVLYQEFMSKHTSDVFKNRIRDLIVEFVEK